DEQTGALFADMIDRFTATDTKKFILYNGRHIDGYSPLVLTRWWEFLELFVAQRVPRMDPLVRNAAGAEFADAFGAPGLGFEPDRFEDFADDDYAGALAAWLAEPPVRVIFESGAGHDQPGAPLGRFEASFTTWPAPSATPRTWYLGEEGRLADAVPSS